ncbi:hypothetical protein AB1K54_09805 [Microbacterium sp. BWT-B31]|uniref:hypothetical protein n=1 Tax=Microbacterium sp. BWT-B31 TaxID=3232072 RepID=UPI0035286138
MSTPEQPASPALTRKQMRQVRNTGTTPVVTPEQAATPEAAPPVSPAVPVASAPVPPPTVVVPAIPVISAVPVAPLARAAEPPVLPERPVADAAVDLGVSPLTRRQARQQERIRTASVPVITPEVAAAYTAYQPAATGAAPVPATDAAPLTPARVVEDAVAAELPPWIVGAADATRPAAEAPAPEKPRAEASVTEMFTAFAPRAAEAEPEAAKPAPAAEPERAPAVNADLGAGLLAGGSPGVTLPPSFDELMTLSTSGSASRPNALIIAQPESPAIISPVTATGEVLITGTLNLPEGLGSTGHAPGVADGKEADAVLVDGELPAHSSPTPIAASAAISTVKTPGEIIKPPAPEKGGRLMMSLAITAGVLALALVGVLILAFATGVFS